MRRGLGSVKLAGTFALDECQSAIVIIWDQKTALPCIVRRARRGAGWLATCPQVRTVDPSERSLGIARRPPRKIGIRVDALEGLRRPKIGHLPHRNATQAAE